MSFLRCGLILTAWLLVCPAVVQAGLPVSYKVDQPSLSKPVQAKPSLGDIAQAPLLTPPGQNVFTSMSVDSGGHWLVVPTGKEVTVYSIATGDIAAVLRTPINSDSTGPTGGVAISPDGGEVAVAWGTERAASIYIFDRATGGVARRIDGLADAVTELTFSRDGRYVIAAVAKGGVQVFDAAFGRLISQDMDYGGQTYSVDICQSADLVLTTSEDKGVRLYRLNAGELSRTNIADGSSFGVASIAARFMADCSGFAVVSNSGGGINIWSTSLFSNTGPIMTPFISAFSDVRFSPDGHYLYAYYTTDSDGGKLLRWSAKPLAFLPMPFHAQSQREEFAVKGEGFVHDVAVLPDGGAVFTLTSGWGRLSPSGTIEVRSPGTAVRYPSLVVNLGKAPTLMVSQDGGRVAFGGSESGASVFDVVKKTFDTGTDGLRPTVMSNSKVPIKLYVHKPATLRGAVIPLADGEFADSSAVSADNGHFALSTSFGVRLFTADGRQVSYIPTPAIAVNFSGDGRWLVADTISSLIWIRVSDGAQMFSLRPDPKNGRWVIWTQSGYYDAAPGAEDEIGWWVNQGLDKEAVSYPLSRFADRMRRPDLIDRIVETGSEEQALGLANTASQRQDTRIDATVIQKTLPPVVELISAPDHFSTPKVDIRVRLNAPADAPVLGAPRVSIDGVWQPASRAAFQAAGDGSRTLSVGPLPQHDVRLEIYADNRNGTSPPLSLTLKWDGVSTVSKAAVVARKPRLFILAVGVSQYRQTDMNLLYADRDAASFIAAMQQQKGLAYSDVVTRVIVNDKADKASIQAGLKWFSSQPGESDVGIIFFAGHGFKTPDDNYFFAGTDFDPKHPRDSGVIYSLIKQALVDFSGRGNRAILMVDTCYSGGVDGSGLNASAGIALASELNRPEYGVYVMTASKGDQFSFEQAQWNDGAFTKALLEGIVDGKADPAQTGQVTMLGLGTYVSRRVNDLTEKQQSPLLMVPQGGIEDFEIARSKK